jgi:cytochrome c-type biogenesis protein CcmE
MKKIYIVAILMIIGAVAFLVFAAGDVSSYANFTEAQQNRGNRVKITGTLVKDKDLVYSPEKDPNYFSFFMKDAEGIEKQVIFNGAKPQDFERSEQIVLTGQMEKDQFIATDILLKCPSKYKEEEISFRSDT